MIEPTEDTEKKDNCGNEWFRNWFGSQYYDLLYSHRNTKEAELFLSALIKVTALAKSASILDLACGKGRHSVFLNSMGYDVTGIDLSEENIAFAKEFSNQHLQFETADMRSFKLNKTFDCVLNLFTSFGYFEHIEDNMDVLKRIKEHLNPDGLFVLDYFNAELVRQQQKNVQRFSINHENIHFDIQKSIQSDFVVKDIQINASGSLMRFEERVQLLDAEELENMLQAAGLKSIALYGNYNLDTFVSSKSERLIIIARN